MAYHTVYQASTKVDVVQSDITGNYNARYRLTSGEWTIGSSFASFAGAVEHTDRMAYAISKADDDGEVYNPKGCNASHYDI